MYKCTKDPEGKKWHKSNKEAMGCGCLVKKKKTETEIKESENNTKVLEKQDEGRLAFGVPAKTAIIPDDKTAATIPPKEAGQVLPASAAELKSETEEDQPEPQKKSWLVEICIAIIFIVLAAIAFFVYFAIPEKEEKI